MQARDTDRVNLLLIVPSKISASTGGRRSKKLRSFTASATPPTSVPGHRVIEPEEIASQVIPKLES